jgi:hypothetical protein
LLYPSAIVISIAHLRALAGLGGNSDLPVVARTLFEAVHFRTVVVASEQSWRSPPWYLVQILL